MADGVTLQVKGLKEMDERMKLLGSIAGEKVMRSVLFSAAKPMLEQTLANIDAIPRGSGALKKATRRVYLRPTGRAGSSSGSRFVVAIAPKTKDSVAIALANLKYKRKRPVRGIFWGHLMEWGFNHRGGIRVAGRRMFSFAAKGARAQESIALFAKLLGPRIERALKRQQP